MKTRVFLWVLLLLGTMAHAQNENYYYFRNSRIDLEKVPDAAFVEYDSYPAVLNSYTTQMKTSQFSVVNTPTLADLNTLKQTAQIKRVYPVYQYADGTRQAPTGSIFIQLKSGTEPSSVLKGIHYTTCTPFPELPGTYLVDLDGGDCFSISNQLCKLEQVNYAHPEFWRFIQPDNARDNPFFPDQWGLVNEEQYGGTKGFDIKVAAAWPITKGNPAITIAVLDEGVELSHPDLRSNLITGYDATGQNSGGGPNSNDYHGTCCAGIISATDNNIGIVGIAPRCKIIPIRIAYKGTDNHWISKDSWINNGFLQAKALGADICSNSWSGGSPSDIYVSTINSLATTGRETYGSVGMPIFFASSNSNASYVSFPANLENTIAVGAASMCGQRKSPSSCDGENYWGSNYGPELHVLAPGVKIPTTDITGSAGKNSGNNTADYRNGDYTGIFNGTSAATPHAAGVAALMLSVNPLLNRLQLTEILDSTCTKLPNYNYSADATHPYGTWNNETGYGMINAYKAVQAAQSALPRVLLKRQIIHPTAPLAVFEFIVLGTTIPNACKIDWEFIPSQEGIIKSYSITPKGNREVSMEVQSNYNFIPAFHLTGHVKSTKGRKILDIECAIRSITVGRGYSLNHTVANQMLSMTHQIQEESPLAAYSARSTQKETVVNIYSSQMKVLSQKIDSSQEQINIDVSGLANGNYIVNVVEDGTTVWSENFIIKH